MATEGAAALCKDYMDHDIDNTQKNTDHDNFQTPICAAVTFNNFFGFLLPQYLIIFSLVGNKVTYFRSHNPNRQWKYFKGREAILLNQVSKKREIWIKKR